MILGMTILLSWLIVVNWSLWSSDSGVLIDLFETLYFLKSNNATVTYTISQTHHHLKTNDNKH